MLTPPTDNLYKFLAIFGIAIAFSSSAFWWKSENDFDSFFESNGEYLNVMLNNNEIYASYIQKGNEGIDIFNSVSGKYELLTEDQRLQLDRVLEESEKLKAEIETIEKANKSKILVINARMEKDKAAKLIGFSGVIFGLIIASIGFYLWYSRLQKYIDKLQSKGKA